MQVAAERIGTTARTVQRLIARGELQPVRLPGVRRVLIDEADLTNLVKAGKGAAGVAPRPARALRKMRVRGCGEQA